MNPQIRGMVDGLLAKYPGESALFNPRGFFGCKEEKDLQYEQDY